MRFLHLADVHLDTPFRGRSRELATRLREAGRAALVDAVEVAIRESADAFLIAGDLFDGERLSWPSERLLVESMERLLAAGIHPLYATGNHDPGRGAGLRAGIAWPEGMTVFDESSPRRVAVEREGRPIGWVTGAGHEGPAEARDLSATFPRPPGPLPEVALLHTQVLRSRGADSHDRYAPSSLDELIATEYDYWALGHVHLRQELSGDPAVHYPGNPQGRHPGESGARGALLVDVERGSPARATFVELARVRWETLEAGDLRELGSWRALVDRITRRWEEARRPDPGLPGGEWIVRVELTGPSPLASELARPDQLAELEAELRAELGALDLELRTSGLLPSHRPAEHRERVDVLGEALRLLEAIEEGRLDDPAALLGIEPGELAGLEERDTGTYLRELLQERAPALMETLLQPEARG